MVKASSKWVAIANVVVLSIDVVALIALSVFVEKFYELFSTAGVQIPPITKTVLSSRYLSIIIALLLIVKERILKKGPALIFNSIILSLLAFLILPIVVVGLFAPVFMYSPSPHP